MATRATAGQGHIPSRCRHAEGNQESAQTLLISPSLMGTEAAG